jgi:hypothetical protein
MRPEAVAARSATVYPPTGLSGAEGDTGCHEGYANEAGDKRCRLRGAPPQGVQGVGMGGSAASIEGREATVRGRQLPSPEAGERVAGPGMQAMLRRVRGRPRLS